MSEFEGQSVAVIGLAATGLATAKVLREMGARVTIYDGKPENILDPARVAEVHELDGVVFRPATDIVEHTTDLLVPSPGVPRYAKVLTDAVSRNIPILGEIEIAYRLAKAPILAITGTNGKTTTTALVGAICREAGLQTWVAGNIAEDAGKRLPLIQAAVEAPADGVIAAEISSFQLEWVEQFRPKVAAWLNLSTDHLDRHKDMDEYAHAKSNIFRAQTEDDFAIFNLQDEIVRRFTTQIAQMGRAKRIPFVVGGPSPDGVYEWHGEVWAAQFAGRTFPGLSHDLRVIRRDESPLQGAHNTANICAGTAMALSLGLRPETIRTALRSFRGVAHRMEFVAEVGGVRYINNSMCTNPAALVASVSALDTPLISISGGIHKGGDLAEVGKALATHARHTVLIGKSAGEFADAIKAAGSDSYSFADSLPDAVCRASAVAKAGETVMLAPGCASFDMFSGFEERGQIFREAVKALWQS
jgi:UDP-N-acetylmuramoylalanine--D-glutamate ligase